MTSRQPVPEQNQDIRIGVTSVCGVHYACWKRDGTAHLYTVAGWQHEKSTPCATREAFDALCLAWGIEPVTAGAKVRKGYISETIF